MVDPSNSSLHQWIPLAGPTSWREARCENYTAKLSNLPLRPTLLLDAGDLVNIARSAEPRF